MKKKALLSSILTITLCLSLIAGSTFALFTDTTDFNIAVTAGKVDLEAYAGISDVYSAVGVEEGEVAEDRFLVDENDNEYKHVASLDKETFINGGVAELEGTSLKIARLTPGDKVDVTINVTNNSNVAISYRYKIAVNTNSTYDNELASGMVLSVIDGLTFAETSYEGFESYVSEWYYVEAPAGAAGAIDPRTISVELPVYAGNEYQTEKAEGKTESVEYTLIVEAVQGNVNTVNEEKIVVYDNTPKQNIPPVLSDYFDPATNSVYIHDLYLHENANILVDQNYELTLENVTTDVNGSVIILDEYNPAILIMNCEFNLDAGEYIIDASAYGTAYQVFLVNVTVNGELLELGVNTAEAGQYLKNVGWYQVVDPNLVS